MADPLPDEHELLQRGFRFALSLTHHHHDAEDLVHQAWLKLTHAYGRVEGTAILFTAIRNLFYDQRRRGAIVVFEPLEGAPEPAAAPVGNPSGDLDTLLAGLRAEEREAVYLHAVEGHTAAEIAERMACPRGTVLSLIFRAKRKLARALGLESHSPACPEEVTP